MSIVVASSGCVPGAWPGFNFSEKDDVEGAEFFEEIVFDFVKDDSKSAWDKGLFIDSSNTWALGTLRTVEVISSSSKSLWPAFDTKKLLNKNLTLFLFFEISAKNL